jgi:hypothetical protein
VFELVGMNLNALKSCIILSLSGTLNHSRFRCKPDCLLGHESMRPSVVSGCFEQLVFMDHEIGSCLNLDTLPP